MKISDILKNFQSYQEPFIPTSGTASNPVAIHGTSSTPPDTSIEKDFEQLIKSCNDVFAELIDDKKIIINANRLSSGYPIGLKIFHAVPVNTSTVTSYSEYVPGNRNSSSGSQSTYSRNFPFIAGEIQYYQTADLTTPVHFEEDLDKLAKSIEDYNNVVQDIIVGVKRLKDEYESKSIKLNIKVSQESLKFEVEIGFFNGILKKISNTTTTSASDVNDYYDFWNKP